MQKSNLILLPDLFKQKKGMKYRETNFTKNNELAGFTAGKDFHPAPKNKINLNKFILYVNNYFLTLN